MNGSTSIIVVNGKTYHPGPCASGSKCLIPSNIAHPRHRCQGGCDRPMHAICGIAVADDERICFKCNDSNNPPALAGASINFKQKIGTTANTAQTPPFTKKSIEILSKEYDVRSSSWKLKIKVNDIPKNLKVGHIVDRKDQNHQCRFYTSRQCVCKKGKSEGTMVFCCGYHHSTTSKTNSSPTIDMKPVHIECFLKFLDEINIKQSLETIDLLTGETTCHVVCGKRCLQNFQKMTLKAGGNATKQVLSWHTDGNPSSMEVLLNWLTNQQNADRFLGKENTSHADKSFGGEDGETKMSLCNEIATLIKEKVGVERDANMIKNKINTLITKFKETYNWSQCTGQGVLEDDGELAFNDALLKRFRYYSILEPVLSGRPNVTNIFNTDDGITDAGRKELEKVREEERGNFSSSAETVSNDITRTNKKKVSKQGAKVSSFRSPSKTNEYNINIGGGKYDATDLMNKRKEYMSSKMDLAEKKYKIELEKHSIAKKALIAKAEADEMKAKAEIFRTRMSVKKDFMKLLHPEMSDTELGEKLRFDMEAEFNDQFSYKKTNNQVRSTLEIDNTPLVVGDKNENDGVVENEIADNSHGGGISDDSSMN